MVVERISKYKQMNKYISVCLFVCLFVLAAYNMFYLIASVVL